MPRRKVIMVPLS